MPAEVERSGRDGKSQKLTSMYCFLYMIINLHFTSRKMQAKNTDKQNYTIRYNIPESTWEYKITNNNK